MKISVHCDYRPERLTENTPPESVCILFRDGSLFGVKSAVVLIGAYVTNDVNINKAYERKLGRSLIEELSEYIYMQRMIYNREVILMGYLNAYTSQHAGWDGSDAYFSTDYEEGERRSYCNAERNARGTELVRLAQLNELRVLNGLELSKFSGDPFITRPSVGCDVAPPSREEPGTVLDYVLASEAALQSFSKLTVGAGMHSSDHRPVRFVWRGGGAGADGSSADAAPRGERSGPLGWRLSGHPTDEQQRAVAEVLAADRRLGDVCSVLQHDGADAAFSLVAAMVREAWAAVGINVALSDGQDSESRSEGPRMPVHHWWSEEVRKAQRLWHALRRKKHLGEAQRAACSYARRAFEKAKSASKRRWRTHWERYWCDVSKCKHTSVWKVVANLDGRSGADSCRCNAAYQRAHYARNGRPRENPDFDAERAREAEAWLADFLSSGRGRGGGASFSETEVHTAFKRLRQCAPGIDGLSKMWMKPLETALLPAMTALFSYVYSRGVTVEYWTLAVIVSIRKKDPSLTNMDNFRGVHLLSFCRQWYAMCLLPKLEELVARVTPIEQQGFLRGGRIYASYMALYALIERARVQGQRLYVAFVDVRKAFPSVRRDLLWRKLKVELGASDELVAALIALYTDACATVQGPDGRSDTFGISLGTREGGVEAPLLYILFVADLVAMLQDVPLTDGEATLDGHPVRALQLADDLALIAESEDDSNRLLAQWARHCDLNHQETQIAKTEVVIFTSEGDGDLVMVEGRVRLGGGEPLEFCYKADALRVVQTFAYLGVLYDCRSGPTSALEYRDDKAWKVLGALKNSLRRVPFLPQSRVAEMGEAMVGGTFLYSAELWAPYLDLRKARVPRA